MWECPICSRAFNKKNQHHFCGADKSESIDAYITGQADDVKAILEKTREIIREAAPNAKEKMSWQMPTFWQGENLIHFCAQKKHLGIYPGELIKLPEEIRQRLEVYKTSKGAIQFPYYKPIDYTLISDITKWRVTVMEDKLKQEKS